MVVIPHAKSAFGVSTTGGTFNGNFTSGTNSSATSKSFTYTANATGNAVLFWVTMVPSSTSPTTCSLSATGWAFSQIGGIVNGGTAAGCGAMFLAYAPNTSLATVTMTWNQPTVQWFADLIDEFSGTDTTNCVAASNATTGSGTPTVSLTPPIDDCMIWVPCNDNVTAVGSIGGSTATKAADDAQSDWSEYRQVTGGAGVSQTCTFTGSGSYIIGAVAIKSPGPTIGSVPSGTAMTAGSLSAPFLFFDTGDYSPGL